MKVKLTRVSHTSGFTWGFLIEPETDFESSVVEEMRRFGMPNLTCGQDNNSLVTTTDVFMVVKA